MMQTITRILACLLLAGLTGPVAHSDTPAVITTAYFRADWCGNCRLLDPVWADVRTRSIENDIPVTHTVLDLTASAARYDASVMTLLDLRLGPVYNRYVGLTGLVFIAASDTGELVDCLTRLDTASVMLQRLEAAQLTVATHPPGDRPDPVGERCPAPLRIPPGG